MNEGGSWSGREKNCVYLNLGDGSFANVSANSAADFADDARAMARCDWDDDGRVDIFLKNRSAPRLRFLHNQEAAAGGFLSLELVGKGANRDAIGARVRVEAGDAIQHRTLRAGEGYLSQSSKRLHFGLGAAQSVQSVTVRWPDGSETAYAGLRPDSRYQLVQGDAAARPVAPRTHAAMAAMPAAALAPDPGLGHRIILLSKLPLAPLPLPGFEAPDRKVSDLASGPVLVNLWASWCVNCLKEFDAWSAHAGEFRAAGLRIVTMTTDEAGAFPVARKKLAEFGLSADAGVADAGFLANLEVVFAEIFGPRASSVLPTSLLLDRSGQLVAVYRGPVDPAVLLADAKVLAAMEPENPFGARLAGGLPTLQYRRDYRGMAEAFLGLGERELALFFQQLAARGGLQQR